jgi:hypothetical protein
MAKSFGFPLMLVLIALIIGFTITTMANPIFDDQVRHKFVLVQ